MGRLDRTAPGGRYMVGGKLVDASGAEIKEEAAAFDVDSATLDELKAEAERRGVEVTRGDKKDGAPVKADYVAALS